LAISFTSHHPRGDEAKNGDERIELREAAVKVLDQEDGDCISEQQPGRNGKHVE
jgi:hypothetical protein